MFFAEDAAAQAGEDEVFFTVGPEYAAAPNFRATNRGVGGSLGTFWGFHRLWSLGGHVAFAHHFPLRGAEERGGANVFSAFAGPSFNIDVLTVVPFVSLMPGVYADGGALGDGSVLAGVRGALGFDYRPRRHFSVGSDIAWHVVPVADGGFPGYSVFRIRLSYIWDLRAL